MSREPESDLPVADWDQDDSIDYITALRAIQRLAYESGDWAGLPMPVRGQVLVVEERYPHRDMLERIRWTDDDGPRKLTDEEIHASREEAVDAVLASSYYSHAKQALVYIEREPVLGEIAKDGSAPIHLRAKKAHVIPHTPHEERLKLGLETLGAAFAWDINAELNAMARLQTLVTERQFHHYVTCGSFIETSKRSRVTYWFRRARPTIALRPRGCDDDIMRVIAALCLHPIAYYHRTHAGAMVPTDDVLAHLLLMRGDEHRYWRFANQHSPEDPNSGL